jgi:hypothetical protein
MERILAQRFDPFNFSVVPDFPNVVLAPNEWNDYFPIFREHKEHNPAQHINEFHELVHQWEIHHEDVLMKMLMFSLTWDACEWYHSLPPTSISSLGEFHAAFNAHCQKLYPSKLIYHSSCEGYNDCIQGIATSYAGCEEKPDDLDQKSVLSLPCSFSSEEICKDGDPEEEDALSELMELVKSLSEEIDKLKA